MEVTRVDNPLKMFYSEGSYEGVGDECKGGRDYNAGLWNLGWTRIEIKMG